mmetsp:Transcript_13821/g.40440  ORF Transcript_13821/g.40440 Transcript_13821/m.40440 type:complete len:247 (+) Transcript_13821:723-1463(+)
MWEGVVWKDATETIVDIRSGQRQRWYAFGFSFNRHSNAAKTYTLAPLRYSSESSVSYVSPRSRLSFFSSLKSLPLASIMISTASSSSSSSSLSSSSLSPSPASKLIPTLDSLWTMDRRLDTLLSSPSPSTPLPSSSDMGTDDHFFMSFLTRSGLAAGNTPPEAFEFLFLLPPLPPLEDEDDDGDDDDDDLGRNTPSIASTMPGIFGAMRRFSGARTRYASTAQHPLRHSARSSLTTFPRAWTNPGL